MQSQFRSTSSHSQNQPTLGQSLQRTFKAVAAFMVHRPQPSAPSPIASPKDKYSTKASLYPYLPKSEEQRDWLERLY
ncbi:MAG: hypothetical protein WA885_04270 [Phormidesmis sp.]